ncbi:MAG TPA: hypothetical protein VM240_13050 [Verrucomicrobiae bacterium]|nr:hypothetical protein [Verrucomicrobiae bacterium]
MRPVASRIDKQLRIAAAVTTVLPCGAEPTAIRTALRTVLPDPPRRVNRMIELALLGAHRCLHGRIADSHCPLYLAVTHGSIADNVHLVSGVSSTGAPPMPVGFINLSSNMAGFYVASTLGVHGSNQALASGELSFEAALELVGLGRERRSQALIGAVEECGWPLAEHRERLALPAGVPLVEASHWLFVDADCQQPLATVQWVRRFRSLAAAQAAVALESLPEGTVREVDGALDGMHSGQRGAYRICRFIEAGAAPALLHVAGDDRAAYAVLVTR